MVIEHTEDTAREQTSRAPISTQTRVPTDDLADSTESQADEVDDESDLTPIVPQTRVPI